MLSRSATGPGTTGSSATSLVQLANMFRLTHYLIAGGWLQYRGLPRVAMKVWISSAFENWPCEPGRSGRFAALGLEMARRGHAVTWFTTDFRHSTKRYAVPRNNYYAGDGSLSIVPFHVPCYRTNRSVARLASHAAFCGRLAKMWLALASDCPADIVLAANGPPGACHVAAIVARRHGSKLVIDAQDMWPDSLVRRAPKTLRFLARLGLRRSRQRLKNAVSSADFVCGISSACVEYLTHLCRWREIPSKVYYLGTDMRPLDLARNATRELRKPDRTIRLAYIGSFSRLYDLATVLRAAAELAKSSVPAEWHLIGDGDQRRHLESLSSRLGLSNRVFFHGYMSFQSAAPILVGSDVGLVPIIADWDSNVPNKIADYLGAGLVIASTIPGEVASLIEREKVGYTYPPGKAQNLAHIVLQMFSNPELVSRMRSAALNLARRQFDGNHIAEEYASDLERLAAL